MGRPLLLRVRASVPFVVATATLGLLGETCGAGVLAPIVPFELTEWGYDAQDVARLTGWLVATPAASGLVSSLVFAVLFDWLGRRRGPFVAASLVDILAVLLRLFSRDVKMLFVGQALHGVASSAAWTLCFMLVAEVVAPAFIGTAMSLLLVRRDGGDSLIRQIGAAAGILIGPATGGALYDLAGWHAPWYFALAILVLDLAMRLCVVELVDARALGHQPRWAISVPDATSVEDEKATIMTRRERLVAMTDIRLLSTHLAHALVGLYFFALIDGGVTILIHARYGFTARTASLLFLGLAAPLILIGWLVGRAIDRWSADAVGLVGLAFVTSLMPILLVRLPFAGLFVVAMLVCAFLADDRADLAAASFTLVEPSLAARNASIVAEGRLGHGLVFSLDNVSVCSVAH